MKVSKGQSQPEIVAAAFEILYMVLGSPFFNQVLIVTHMCGFRIGLRQWFRKSGNMRYKGTLRVCVLSRVPLSGYPPSAC